MAAANIALSHNPNKDFEVPQPPSDSVSSLTWSPKANLFVAGSWDSKVRCWEVQQGMQTVPKAILSHDAPVLCTAWSPDGTKIFSGSCDKTAKMWDITTGQSQAVASHQAPIKEIFFVDTANVLVTGSWDKTLKYWDLRQQMPALTVNLPERVYSMDASYPLLVVATAERHILIFDLKQPTVEYKRLQSPLKYQSRTVASFLDRTGFALGSIEGRCAIHHVEDRDAGRNFAFKCHRENEEIYAVNCIKFHPVFGTFATAGSDGTVHFWDKDSKQRLKPFPKCNMPISACGFNGDGSIFAYAVSYDWSKGAEYHNPQYGSHIMLHPTPEAEIKPRMAKAGTGRR
eukprot:TRINITY_DN14564_c0_g1_i1.p1 TRINITY_DN14564_c0_g1~~TRINITY_DN14564_c0_g1_i1.p1  ORF type:complete len:343 (-),score=63.68 TRINITY_DN14564_c0_g1_i1:42-1070(-)